MDKVFFYCDLRSLQKIFWLDHSNHNKNYGRRKIKVTLLHKIKTLCSTVIWTINLTPTLKFSSIVSTCPLQLLPNLRSLTPKLEITTKMEKRVHCVVPTPSYRSLRSLQKQTTGFGFFLFYMFYKPFGLVKRLMALRAIKPVSRRFWENWVVLGVCYGNLKHKNKIFLD